MVVEKIILFIIFYGIRRADACSTFAATPKATLDGSTLIAHSNDGDGDVAGNIVKIPAMDWKSGSMRSVSYGQIPQVYHTYAYYTEGYAIMNEFQVGLAESTCSAIFTEVSENQQLDIVDLGKIALERSSTALEAVLIMGNLSTLYGYRDAGESLLVSDPKEVYIFHILPDDSGKSAVWVAQKVPDGHITTVMNAFVIREVLFSDPENFLFSSNLPKLAEQLGWDPKTGSMDFTATFSGSNEMTCKYTSGRRMWSVYNSWAPSAALSPFYSDYTTSAPYPATIQPDFKLNTTLFFAMMRDTYQDTIFSLSADGLAAAGAFSTPSRWVTPQTTSTGESVCWERPISTFKSAVSFVAQSRGWLPNSIGGTVWFSPHSSRAGCYTPFAVGMRSLPVGWTSNTMSDLNRGVSAYWAFKYLYNIVELKASYMILSVREKQQYWEETVSVALQRSLDQAYRMNSNITAVEESYKANADAVVRSYWQLSDELVMSYADGFCNGCGQGAHHIGYPTSWLDEVYKPPLHG